MPTHISNAAHNTGLVLSCFQIVVVYTTSGVWKLLGDEWLDGTALFYALRIDNFMLYPALNELLWQSTQFIQVATFISLWVQTLFVVFVLWRPTRIFALVSLIFMHLGIGLLLGLWTFSLVMIALDMLFVRDKTWNAIHDWIKGTKHRMGLRTQTATFLGHSQNWAFDLGSREVFMNLSDVGLQFLTIVIRGQSLQ